MSKKVKFINGFMFDYEILKLVDFYDPILRKPTEWVDFDKIDSKTIGYYSLSLMETLNSMEGLGLSANQVGLNLRMFSLNVGKEIWILINPRVISTSSKKSKYKEGCLSYPGLYLEIGRPDSVTIEFNAMGGELITKTFDGLTATCVLHELDHLDGIVYTDRVPKIKYMKAKEKVKSNLKKIKRLQKQEVA